jgi:hypothetical protein
VQGGERFVNATSLQPVLAQPAVLHLLEVVVRLALQAVLDRHPPQQVHDPFGVVLGASPLGLVWRSSDRVASGEELTLADPQEGLDRRRVVDRWQVVAGHRY